MLPSRFLVPAIPNTNQAEVLRRLNSGGDWVLAAQPGGGKSFLLERLAEHRQILFVQPGQFTEHSAALKTSVSNLVVVKDASFRLDEIRQILEYRAELALSFDLVATCLPSEVPAVLGVLGADDSRVCRLEGWNRREMRQLLSALGVDNEAIAPVLRQSGTNPGRALTLAKLWQANVWVQGRELGLIEELDRHLGREALCLLAVLSLGGRNGVALEKACAILGLEGDKRRTSVAKLAAAGLFEDLPSGHLRVQPRELWFLGFVMPEMKERISGLLMQLADADANALDLILTVAPSIPHQAFELCVPLLQRLDDTEAWQRFVSLGERHAQIALEVFPESLSLMPCDLLRVIPREALQGLLKLASQNTNRCGEVLIPINTWLWATEDPAEAQERNSQVREEARRFVQAGGDDAVALRAIALTLLPRSVATLALDSLGPYLAEGWTAVLQALLQAPNQENMRIILHLLGLWWESSRRPARPQAKAWRQLAEVALRDLATRNLIRGGPAVELRARAADFGFAL